MSFLTLRVRTFLFMMLILVVAFVLTGIFSLYHFRAENKNYHYERLERKEQAIISHIDYFTGAAQGQSYTPWQWKGVLGGKVAEISSIHKLDVGIYHPSGLLIAASSLYSEDDSLFPRLLTDYAESSKAQGRHVVTEGPFLISTSEILGRNNEVELIIRVPYKVDESSIPDEDVEFLQQLVLLYVFLFLFGILFAFVLSNYISKNMRLVIDQLKKVRINGSNEKLTWRLNDEIGELIQEYNVMVEKLERTAVELAQSERESAWKEMAQQVAHEIKNPLTPMKLTLQMMERVNDPEELQEMASHLLEEVETLTSIAEAFSRFAQMPGLVLEEADISYLTQRALGLYADRGVQILAPEPVRVKVDKEQWSRIVHNLVKNALQSIEVGHSPKVSVHVAKDDEGNAVVTVSDNGTGIPEHMQERIFEPNFTTKSSGMGLGLALVKNLIENFGGTISFESSSSGTEFRLVLPLSNQQTQK